MEGILPVNINKIHFVGIGGIGMSGLARLLLDKGYAITGSDVKNSQIIHKLRRRGVRISVPHNPGSVKGADLVCFSSAIGADNPELREAKILKVPVIRRGVLLGKILRDKKVLAVAGSHGKTTTTSLASFVLKKAGLDIASLVGGIPHYVEDSSWWGRDLFVVETDESDASFLRIKPTYSIITNIDKEHLNFYGSFKKLKESFLDFAKNTKDLIIGLGDQKEVLRALLKSGKEYISFGFSSSCLIRAKDIRLLPSGSEFRIFHKNKYVTGMKIPLLGKHNILNALSVAAFCLYSGYNLNKLKNIFNSFPGTGRRFDFKGTFKGVCFVDDYAHHPREIESTLAAASLLKKKRLIVLFQPHRFSRVKELISEFSSCFRDDIDSLIITDIYSASEAPISGVDVGLLIKKIKRNYKKDIMYIPREKLAEKVPLLLMKGDCLFSLGAGDINKILEQIIKKWCAADE
ncbi:MAG: UDP-N-acetylmuramate--L-alanine ligase [Candidatus Omnitrophica bacterium]|nr:UDP-N-acetylmuramate--L-alanine ligase [Candidatus Omnitrophota bacterium]